MRRRFAPACIVLVLALAAGLAPALAAEKEEKDWGYDKGLYFRTSDFEIKLGGRVQFRFTGTDPDGGDSIGEFRIPRARFFGSGFAYKPWIKYKFQFDLVGNDVVNRVTVDDADLSGDLQEDEVTSSRSRGADLRDFYIDFAKHAGTTLRVGQYKAPFGLQELTSSGSLQFVDRSIASEEFAPSRDQGVMLHGLFNDKTFGYEAGVFNGNGRNKSSNDNNEFMYAVRAHFDPNGEYKLQESAVDSPGKVLWTIGGGWLSNATDPAGDLNATTLEGFFGLAYRRLSVLADYYTRTEDLAGGGEVDSDGYIAQVGYFFVPGSFEVALRSSQVDPDTDADDDGLSETGIALNWFLKKHNFKVQADYRQLTEESPLGDLDTDQARVQLQVIF